MRDDFRMQMLTRTASNTSFMTPLPKFKSSKSDGSGGGGGGFITEKRSASAIEAALYASLTKHMVEKFAIIDKLPEGYQGPYIGQKGERGDWGELIATFYILIVLVLLTAIVTLIGMIYCFLRMNGRCSPYINASESIGRKICRCCTMILALVIVILIVWALGVSIIAYRYVYEIHDRRIHRHDSETTVRELQIEHVLTTNFDELIKHSQASANVLIDDNLERMHELINPALSTVLNCKSKTDNAMKEMANLINHIEVERIDVIEWTDFMRHFQRNMIYWLMQSKAGEEIMKNLQFSTFRYTFLHMDTLVSVKSSVNSLKYVISNLNNRLQEIQKISKNVEENIRVVLNTVLKNAQNSLDHKGNKFRFLSQNMLQHCRNSPYRSGNSSAPYNSVPPVDTMYIPTLFLYLPWLSYILVVLICICVLIGFIFALLGKSKRAMRSNCFQFAICLIFLSYPIILLTFLWYFFYGVVLYNNRSEIEVRQRSVAQSFCRPGKTLLESMQSEGLIDQENHTLQTDVESLSIELDDKLPTVIDLQESIIETKRAVSVFSNGLSCDPIIKTPELENLTRIYTEMSTYVNGSMENKWGHRDLAICQLAWLKRTKTDPLEHSELSKRENQMIEGCKRIELLFGGNIQNLVDECLLKLEEVLNFYTNNTKSTLKIVINDLDEIYNKNTAAYNDMMIQTLENDIGVCQSVQTGIPHRGTIKIDYAKALNGVWSGMFLILFLLLPLLLVLCCLTKIYDESTSRSSSKSLAGMSSTKWVPMEKLGRQHLILVRKSNAKESTATRKTKEKSRAATIVSSDSNVSESEFEQTNSSPAIMINDNTAGTSSHIRRKYSKRTSSEKQRHTYPQPLSTHVKQNNKNKYHMRHSRPVFRGNSNRDANTRQSIQFTSSEVSDQYEHGCEEKKGQGQYSNRTSQYFNSVVPLAYLSERVECHQDNFVPINTPRVALHCNPEVVVQRCWSNAELQALPQSQPPPQPQPQDHQQVVEARGMTSNIRKFLITVKMLCQLKPHTN